MIPAPRIPSRRGGSSWTSLGRATRHRAVWRPRIFCNWQMRGPLFGTRGWLIRGRWILLPGSGQLLEWLILGE
jgi:hypothetical protein